MPTIHRPPACLLVLGLGAAALLAACGGPAPSAAGPEEAPTTTLAGVSPPAMATPSAAAELTPVPGGGTGTPDDPDRPPTTTVTDWGRILDVVPEDVPVYPGAAEAPDAVDEPVSGAWLAGEGVEAVAAWYVAAFEELGWSRVELGSGLEDGTRVLDLASDLPECRAQAAFRPADGSTIIIVRYGAGCAGGDG